MTTERWRQIETLFHSALDRAPDDRAEFLDQACSDDRSLREDVENLLKSFEEAGDFIEKPIVDDPLSPKSRKSPLSESLIGHKVGNYEVLSLLGAGGMGEVYLARDARLDRQIALKILPVQFTQDRAQVERFEREARAASALNHPNIITIHDIGREGDAHFIATEFVQGRTLREIIANGKMPLRESLGIAFQIAGALQAAHAAGIVHRDIKPENVMVRDDGLVKLLDFGLAKPVGERETGGRGDGETGGQGSREIERQRDFLHLPPSPRLPVSPSPRPSQMTDPRMLMGTLTYLSPEQARGEKVDHRTDIFSLGVVIYEMVAGTRPFSGETLSETLDEILNRAPERVVTEHPRLEYIIERSLAKDRGARYQTAREMQEDLQRLAHELASVSAGMAAFQRRAQALWRSRRAKAAWSFAGMAALIAIWFFPPGRNAENPLTPSTQASARSTRLTYHEREELFPSLAPDGRSLVYASRTAGDWDIYWQDVGGENIRNLTEDCREDDTQPAFSPDGKWIAFRSQREGGGVFVMSATGESVRRLTPAGHYYHPAWSPDGREILCTRENVIDPADRTATQRQLWAFTFGSGEGRLVTSDDVAQPQWSPRGRRIACFGQRQKTQRDIWTMPAHGGEPVDVTKDEHLDWNPVWSPDGKYLYFLSDRKGGMKLFRVAIDEESGKASDLIELVPTPEGYVIRHLSFARNGDLAYAALVQRKTLHRVAFDPARGALAGEPSQFTTDSLSLDEPDISPDGQWIACRIAREGRENILLLKSDGAGEPRLLTNDDYKDRGPQWSPDGRRIAFYSNRSGAWEIWSINNDGGDKRRLTFTESANVYFPLWSPDGARLVYTRHGGVPFVIEVNRPLHERQPQPLLSPDEKEIAFWPRAWSADGQKLAGSWRSKAHDQPVAGLYSFPSRRSEPLDMPGAGRAWLSDNRRLLVRQNEKIILIDSQTQKHHEALNTFPHRLLQFALSRDNRRLYYSLEQTEADIWLMKTRL
jgi:Tol biopolymer transport system component/serine/threonine protein kinase